jgi:hypothetical protein
MTTGKPSDEARDALLVSAAQTAIAARSQLSALILVLRRKKIVTTEELTEAAAWLAVEEALEPPAGDLGP